MTRQLVLVHGRAQENKNKDALKAEWIEALNEGLEKNDLKLPIAERDVRFPFYGDTLYQMTNGVSAAEAAAVVVRGESSDDADEKRFMQAVLSEIAERRVPADKLAEEIATRGVVDRGVLNWGWVQTALQAIDRYVPHGSGASIAVFTRDVYQYLKNAAIRDTIDEGVSAAFSPGVETVVVSHSLGTVVAYSLLRQFGHQRGWKVPTFVTVGSPLAVTEIRKTVRTLAAPTRCPQCASAWFNAMDDRDVVALYPLDATNFPLEPTQPDITNKTDVRNKTENRHGIAGYLDDAEVAKRIHDALVA